MTIVETLLQQSEGKTLEFKENTESLTKIIQTIIAFANTAGGTLVIGVKDRTKEVVGVKDVLQEEERIASAVADSIAPLIMPNFQFHTWRDRDILLISVVYAPIPYYLKNKSLENSVYIRLGSTNRIADATTRAEIQRLAIHQSFDEVANLQATIDDVNFVMASELFSQNAKRFDEQVAKSLSLIVQHQGRDYPSNGALLLFGRDRQRFFPDAYLQCGCFVGTTKTHIIDQQSLAQPLPIMIEQALAFIARNTSLRAEIGPLHRKDIPQYPPVVVREALMNAVVHANYAIKGALMSVAIFSDRLEITNPGALPYGLSLEKALSGMSQLRNRVIGHVFRELGLIERWGSGFGRMIDVCREQGIKAPLFEELDNHFRVTLYHSTEKELLIEPQQQILVDYIKVNQAINTKGASQLWQVTERTASTRLKKMLDNGLLIEISTSPYDPKKIFKLRTHY